MTNLGKSSRMGSEKIGKLLFSMSLPAIFSMLVQALYNVVDSLFVAQVSEKALEAVTIAMPLQMIVISLALGVGVGANALISIRLGERRKDEATKIAQNALFMALIVSGGVAILGLTFSNLFASFFTSDPETQKLSFEYLILVISLGGFSVAEITLSKMLQATGNMKDPMKAQIIGAVVNIILDPLFIFGLWFFPEMGVVGAAIATIIGQACALTFSLSRFIFKKQEISISMKGFRPSKKALGSIFKVALPVTIMNSISSVTTVFLNLILKAYQGGITILGVYFKLQSFVFMPVFGLSQGTMPILGYSFGSKNKERFEKAFKLSTITAFIILTVGFVIFQLFAKQLFAPFDKTGQLLESGAHALKVISLCFIPAAIGISVSTGYQSLAKGFMSLLMSLTRQLIVIVPMALILNLIFKMDGIWFSFGIAEIISVAIFLPLFIKTVKKEFKKLEPTPLPEESVEKV